MTSPAGLDGVIVTQSRKSYVDGEVGRLGYAGYTIEDLGHHSTFEEVCFLLWNGRLPVAAELDALTMELKGARALPGFLVDAMRRLPTTANPMDVLRTAVSLLGVHAASPPDPVTQPAEALAHARRLSGQVTAQLASIVAGWARIRAGQAPVAPRSDLVHAANFLWMLNGAEPDAELAHVLDCCLILHADHGMNASTFAARIGAATLADLHSALTAAIGTLKGPLHGGANTAVMEMLEEIGSEENARAWVEARLARKERLMGFGHRVYKTTDPRAMVLSELARQVAEKRGDARWFRISREIQTVMAEHRQKTGKALFPNVDFFAASTYGSVGIPKDLYTPVFALARVAGWCAHVLEQYENNRLIRPRAEYIGPQDLTWKPIAERTTDPPPHPPPGRAMLLG